MPEGDTIHRVAARLRPALVGKTLVRFEAPRARGFPPRRGATVESVEAVGKHLLIGFGDGTVLRTHLRMSGSWRLVATGERWPRPAHLMRALVEVEGWTAVCFAAPVVELERAPRVDHLGPDLCQGGVDLDECVRRIDRFAEPDVELADVLLDQRIACGVGNVYKSEACFAVGLHPRQAIGTVAPVMRRAVIEAAAGLLQANLGPGRRTTTSGPPGSTAVYGRARRPCRRCGTPVQSARTGPHARSTYWCPTCQPIAVP